MFQVLQSVMPIAQEEVVLGQYDGYGDDPTVPDASNTPTFATIVLRIHNERWEGLSSFLLETNNVLFYLFSVVQFRVHCFLRLTL